MGIFNRKIEESSRLHEMLIGHADALLHALLNRKRLILLNYEVFPNGILRHRPIYEEDGVKSINYNFLNQTLYVQYVDDDKEVIKFTSDEQNSLKPRKNKLTFEGLMEAGLSVYDSLIFSIIGTSFYYLSKDNDYYRDNGVANLNETSLNAKAVRDALLNIPYFKGALESKNSSPTVEDFKKALDSFSDGEPNYSIAESTLYSEYPQNIFIFDKWFADLPDGGELEIASSATACLLRWSLPEGRFESFISLGREE